MPKLLLLCLLAFAACKTKKTPPAGDAATLLFDTSLVAWDTSVVSRSLADDLRDSLHIVHLMDSFKTIKPIAVFVTDNKTKAFRKMVSRLIDTSNITITPLHFTETLRAGKTRNSKQRIYTNARFTIKQLVPEFNSQLDRQLFINGHELRPGIEIDTTLSGSFYVNTFRFYEEEISIMKFGSREYLRIDGGLENCNGMGCGIAFYLLYDIALKKGMLLQQFRNDFVVGYNQQRQTPLFINMGDDNTWFDGLCECWRLSGDVYRFTRTGNIQAATDAGGKQYAFEAFSCAEEDGDTIKVVAGNLPRK